MIAIRIVLGGLVLTVAQALGYMALGAITGQVMPAPAKNPMPWLLVANVIDTAVLVWFAIRSPLRGWRLAAALGALIFGIANLSSLIEARFFAMFGTAEAIGHIVTTFFITVVFVSILVIGLPAPGEDRGVRTRLRISVARFFIASAAYVVIYFAAGMMVFPFIAEFYSGRPMPDPLALVALQFFVRGPMFVALIYLILINVNAARSEAVLLSGVALSILGGLAPLMVPNPYFPDAIRLAHLVEVTVSNFLYGCFVAWLMTAAHAVAVIPQHPEPA